jgi:lipopolysaccharide biosynthesis protein
MIEKEQHFCIYAGYHKKSRIRPDVFEQIKSLSSKYSIIYVVSADESIKEDPLYFELSQLTSKIIIRPNIGYDFGSWKMGIDFLGEKIKNIKSLLLMNDSLYGPIFPMDEIIYNTLNSQFDITSMTVNEQFGHHGQSYYISYNNKVINSEPFQFFWKNFPMEHVNSYEDKIRMVLKYEVRFYHILLKMDFSHKSLFNTEDKSNPTIYSWDKLVDLGMPFIKNTLIFNPQEKFNEMKINFSKINYYLKKNPLLLDKMKKFWIETSDNATNIIY